MTTTAAPTWTLTHVDPATIKPHPDNPRTDLGDLTDLIASVTEVGILEPLVVAPAHPGIATRSMGKATHLGIAGHRRLAAAKKAKLATVPVIVRDDLKTRAQQVEAMLVENLQRVDLTPVEEADAYQLVMDIEGLTQKALAEKVGQPLSRIRDRLRLVKISEPVRAKVQAHQVTITDALAIAEFDDDPKRQADLLKAVGSTDLPFQIRRARQEKQAEVERAALLARLKAAGVTVHKEQPKGSKRLYELHFPDRGYGADRDAWEEKVHGSCPGRTAFMSYSSVEFGCTQPKLHPRPKVKKSKEEVAREAKEKAEVATLTPSITAAAETRAEFLRDLIARGRRAGASRTSPAAQRLRSLIIQQLGLHAGKSYYYGEELKQIPVLLEILGIETPEREKGVGDRDHANALAAAVNEATATLDVDALVVVLDIAAHLSDEAYLRKVNLWAHYSSHQDWLEALTAYGYAWSDFERARFTWDVHNDDGPADRDVVGTWTVAGVVPVEDSGAA